MGLKKRSQKIKQKLEIKNWREGNMPLTKRKLEFIIYCLISGVNILMRGGQIVFQGCNSGSPIGSLID